MHLTYKPLKTYFLVLIVVLFHLQNHSDSKITLYECEDMMGRKFEMCDDYPSLQGMGWCSKEVPSMKVNSGA